MPNDDEDILNSDFDGLSGPEMLVMLIMSGDRPVSRSRLQKLAFIRWMEDSYGMDVDPVLLKNGRSMYPYLKRYNFQQANDLLYEFSKAVRDNDTDVIDRMADAMPEEMKGVSVLDAPRKKVRRSESRGRKAGLFAFRPETGPEPPSPA